MDGGKKTELVWDLQSDSEEGDQDKVVATQLSEAGLQGPMDGLRAADEDVAGRQGKVAGEQIMTAQQWEQDGGEARDESGESPSYSPLSDCSLEEGRLSERDAFLSRCARVWMARQRAEDVRLQAAALWDRAAAEEQAVLMSHIRIAGTGTVEDQADARDYLTRVWGLVWERHQPAPSASQEAMKMQPSYGSHPLACAGRVDKDSCGRSRSARMTCDYSNDSSSESSMPELIFDDPPEQPYMTAREMRQHGIAIKLRDFEATRHTGGPSTVAVYPGSDSGAGPLKRARASATEVQGARMQQRMSPAAVAAVLYAGGSPGGTGVISLTASRELSPSTGQAMRELVVSVGAEVERRARAQDVENEIRATFTKATVDAMIDIEARKDLGSGVGSKCAATAYWERVLYGQGDWTKGVDVELVEWPDDVRILLRRKGPLQEENEMNGQSSGSGCGGGEQDMQTQGAQEREEQDTAEARRMHMPTTGEPDSEGCAKAPSTGHQETK